MIFTGSSSVSIIRKTLWIASYAIYMNTYTYNQLINILATMVETLHLGYQHLQFLEI